MSDKRQTTKTAAILALLPVVILAAACNGVAPTVPSEALASGESGGVTAMTGPAGTCRAITGVHLQVVDDNRTYLWVEATYQFRDSGLARCAAPSWTADRRDMVVDRQNPYRAGFLRSARGRATLTAEAPNGVRNSLRLNLGDVESCGNIEKVDLKVLPSSDGAVVWVQATYLYPGDTAEGCSEPPAFTASRRGLEIHPRDPFRAGIESLPDVDTSITAIAPNGVSGRITF